MPKPTPIDPLLLDFCGAIRALTAHLSANGPRWCSVVAVADHLKIKPLAAVELAIEARDAGLIAVAGDHSVCLKARGLDALSR